MNLRHWNVERVSNVASSTNENIAIPVIQIYIKNLQLLSAL